jgi:putative phosphoserine phosphatase / 1-acylglycerol-3-phosphate O-acyltransferase
MATKKAALPAKNAPKPRGRADRRVLNQTQHNDSADEVGRRPSARRSRDLSAEPPKQPAAKSVASPTAPPKRPSAVAVFDLDRTLLAGGSGPVIQRHLREQGLGPERDIPGAGALFQIFQIIGETRPSMALARLAVRASKGWNVERVAVAAELAADELLAMVQPFAHDLIAQHRAAGAYLVIASTTPDHFVRPLAKRLGFDDVVATRWGTSDGEYDGTYDGPFIWGRAKRDAVVRLAKDLGASLAKSTAYSDSYFDAPMLKAVGHPVAVNPDPRLNVLAVLQRWPIRHLDVPPGVVKVGGIELQQLTRPFARPEFLPNARFEFSGVENIPRTGGAIVCANHRSYFDTAAISLLIARAGRNARFLGKKEVFDAPIIGRLATAFGGIRVDRGTGSNEPLEHAAAALRAGEIVGIMPEGTIPRGPAFFEPELKGRWGAARLAQMSGVLVVPVGLWGTEKVWPRSSRLPSFDVTNPPTITVCVGEPIYLDGVDLEVDTNRIMTAISALLPPEARIRRVPSDEELRLTYPPGYKGDPTTETNRRPGTD